MALDLQIQDDFRQRRLQRLELRYRRAHFVLAGAHAVCEKLRKQPYADESGLRQALQRIEQAQEALVDIQSIIETLNDQQHVAPAPPCSTTPGRTRAASPGAAPPVPAGESNRALLAWSSSRS